MKIIYKSLISVRVKINYVRYTTGKLILNLKLKINIDIKIITYLICVLLT